MDSDGLPEPVQKQADRSFVCLLRAVDVLWPNWLRLVRIECVIGHHPFSLERRP